MYEREFLLKGTGTLLTKTTKITLAILRRVFQKRRQLLVAAEVYRVLNFAWESNWSALFLLPWIRCNNNVLKEKSGEKKQDSECPRAHCDSDFSSGGIHQTQRIFLQVRAQFPSFTQKKKDSGKNGVSYEVQYIFLAAGCWARDWGQSKARIRRSANFPSRTAEILPHPTLSPTFKILSSHFSPNLFGPNSDISLEVTIFLLFSMGCRIGCFYVGLFSRLLLLLLFLLYTFFFLEAAKGLWDTLISTFAAGGGGGGGGAKRTKGKRGSKRRNGRGKKRHGTGLDKHCWVRVNPFLPRMWILLL